MAQLAAIIEKAFYKTPPIVTKQILRHIHAKPGTDVRLGDFCAGEAEAADTLADHVKRWGAKPQTLAVELDRERAQLCIQRLGAPNVINAGFENTAISNSAFGCVWFNPPYQPNLYEDPDGNHQRQEYAFLERTTDKLQPKGVLVCIVQQHMMGRKRFVRFLANHYENVRIYCFPDKEFEEFQQYVILATKREQVANDEQTLNRLMGYARTRPPAIDRMPEQFPYIIPPVSQQTITFQEIRIDDEKVIELVKDKGIETRKQWKEFISPNREITFRPVLRLRRGHAAGLIAAGNIPHLLLGQAPNRILLRGQAVKETIKLNANGEPLPDTCADEDVKAEREVLATKIHVLYENGRYQLITKDNIDAFEQILKDNAEYIEQRIQEKYPPLYTKPDLRKWRKLKPLMPNRRLPQAEKAGLLDHQKQVILALDEVFNHFRTANLVAEPGCGKTPMASALAHVRDAWPAVAVVPPHTVEHWKDNFEATIPGGKAFICENVHDLHAFMRNYKKGEKKLLVLANTTAKLGPGVTKMNRDLRPNAVRAWIFGPRRPTGWEQKKQPAQPGRKRSQYRGTPASGRASVRYIFKPSPLEIKKAEAEGRDPKFTEGELKHVCPRCGGPVDMTAKMPRCDNYIGKAWWDERTQEWRQTLCHEALYAFGPTNKWRVAQVLYDRYRGKFKLCIFDEVHEAKDGASDIGMAHALLSKACRFTLNLTGTIAGGYATDLFHLLYRGLKEIRDEFGFHDAMKFCALHGKLKFNYRNAQDFEEDDLDVGTLSGKRRHKVSVDPLPGYLPTIYQHLLPNTVFMELIDLGYKKVERHEHIVRIKMNDTMRKQYDWMSGRLLELIRKFIRSKDKEERRIALNMMSRYMQTTLYYGQACYREQIITRKSIVGNNQVPITVHSPGDSDKYGYTPERDAQAGAADRFRTLLDIDKRHTDPVHKNNMVLHPAVAPGELTPKEEWLIQLLQQEKAAGRKVLLYVMQTDKRSIVERLLAVLRHHNIRGQALPKGSKAATRESWIKRIANQVDVLICNPKSVKTGLNLIDFCTVIDFEAQASLYDKLQSCRRVDRPTQTKPVHIYYPVYENSLESALFQLMREKAYAAALLAGESAASALADVDVDDIMAELTRRVLEGVQKEEIEGDDLFNSIGARSYFDDIFTQVIDDAIEEVSQAPAAPATVKAPAPEPKPMPVEPPLPATCPKQVANEWEQLRRQQAPAKSRKKPVPVSKDQLSFF